MHDTANPVVESGLNAESVERLETPLVRVRWFQQSGPAVVGQLVRYYNPFSLLIFRWFWALDRW